MLSVSALNRYIKSLVEEDVLLEAVSLRGEISNFTRHSSGHLYFSLKDEQSSISCVMWKDAACSLKWRPENGMEALIYGRVGVYEKQGRYQIYAEVMEDAGRGRLHAMFEALKAKLYNKGYFDPAAKKPLPEDPRTVALVSSPTGAAIRDMIKVAGNLDRAVRLVVVPCLVQGDGAAHSIAKAIETVNRWGGADVMVVGRGGGSVEDLWAFNEEVVAEAIFASRIPVISAVGHEVDFSIADFVADLRASTPSSAIAELIKPQEEKAHKFSQLAASLERAVAMRCYEYESALRSIADSKAFARPAYLYYNHFERLKNLERLMSIQAANHGERLILSASNLFARLEEVSPIKTMKKGYSIAASKGKVIKTVKNVSVGQTVNVTVSDGSFDAVVSNINSEDDIHA